ncbi:MAG: 30S ribosomal protein S3 [Patescibacteria group bacterium]
MGQKVNPKSIRLKINESWKSTWFESKNYAKNLISDIKLRDKIKDRLKSAAVTDVIIDRDANMISVSIYSARPGVIIGRGGAGSEKIKEFVEKETGGKARINIVEVKKPETVAAYVASNVAFQLEKRMPFRRAMKQAAEKAKESGVRGIKVQVSGRLNGADIARTEKVILGTVPLSTFKSGIDYSYVTALTTYGIIGVKVWIYNGEREIEFAKTEK